MLIGAPASANPSDSPSPGTPIPLYSLLLECEVTDALASIRCVQRFQNEGESPLECAFRLPVDEDAAIVDLTITTDDGRVLTAAIEDKDTAREMYSDAISSGHTAAVGEMNDEKEFVINIGNLPQHTGLQTTIAFVLPLKCKESKWLFAVPQWVVPAWTKTPISANRFRMLSMADQRQQFAFGLTVSQSNPILTIESATHSIEFSLDKLRLHAEVALCGDRSGLQPSDTIEIEFTTSEDLTPKLQTQFDAETGEYAGMLSLIPPLLAPGQTAGDLEGKGDFVILIDRSGSMYGNSISMAKEAAVLFIKSLSEGNTFNVVSFGSSFAKLFPKSKKVSTKSVEAALSAIANFDANMGGTNILSPLEAIFAEQVTSSLARSLYLLTDGGVDDSQKVVACLQTHSKQARVHTFGIGSCVDKQLMREAAKASHGACEFIHDPANIKKKVISVLRKSVLPALSDLKVTWPTQKYEQFPSNKLLPVCYFGELLTAFVHYGDQQPPPQAVTLKCVDTSNGSGMAWDVPVAIASVPGNSVHKLWAKHAIRELTLDYKETSSADTLARLKTVSKKYGIPSEHTSFVCVAVGDEPVTGSVRSAEISLTALHAPPAIQTYTPSVGHSMQTKGARGLGKVGAKRRHRRCVRESIEGITKPAMKRLVRRGGVTRVSESVFEATRDVLKDFLSLNEGSMVAYTEHGGRTTVSKLDVVSGLKRNRNTIYGIEGDQQGASQRKRRIRRVVDREPGVETEEKPARTHRKGKPDVSKHQASQPVSKRSQAALGLNPSLLDLITQQDISGKWLFSSVPSLQALSPLPPEFAALGKDGKDLWMTLCVVVLLEWKFAAEADEWELVVRKAKRRLRAAGVEIGQFVEVIRSSLANSQ